MAASGNLYPGAYMVDTHTPYPPPLPPKPVQFRRRNVAQHVLYALVILALFGMAVEACFIYRLYTKPSLSVTETQQMSKQVADRQTPRPNPVVLPSKPLAHMTAGSQKPTTAGLMLWEEDGDSTIHGMKYMHGRLVVQEEGYYFVYSKVYFSENSSISLSHSVVRTTDRYPKELVLLQSREYHPKSAKNVRTNSFLGGTFHFFKDDSIFVRVNNTQIIRSTSAENYFGAYMM